MDTTRSHCVSLKNHAVQSKYVQFLFVNHSSIKLGGKELGAISEQRLFYSNHNSLVSGSSHPILSGTNGTAGDTWVQPADDRSRPGWARPAELGTGWEHPLTPRVEGQTGTSWALSACLSCVHLSHFSQAMSKPWHSAQVMLEKHVGLEMLSGVTLVLRSLLPRISL